MKYIKISILLIFLGILSYACGKGNSPGGGGGTTSDIKTIEYASSNVMIPNPERGFMKTYIVSSGGAALNVNSLNLLKDQKITLILRLFYLDAFKDKPISSDQLTFIQNDLNAIRNAGLKCIVRFAYATDMNQTDAPLSVITGHIDQLKPVLESNKDIIAFIQAGFIGAWGEWHASTNGLATTANRKAVLEKLLSVLPAEIMVQVRTPGYKQQIFNTATAITSDIAYTADNKARVGHHNDCFLSGGDEYGTYTNITAEKQYISNEALFVPVGGETCPPTNSYSPNCSEGRTQMQLLKWTYLNLDWYQPTVDAWRSSGCFEEFHKNLGYRLSLTNAKLPNKISAGAGLPVEINITNKGYAPMYMKKDVSIVLKNTSSNSITELPVNIDLRVTKPNITTTIKETLSIGSLAAGSYKMYLKIADKNAALKSRPEYSVQLANANIWVTENGGMNDLNHTLTIN